MSQKLEVTIAALVKRGSQLDAQRRAAQSARVLESLRMKASFVAIF